MNTNNYFVASIDNNGNITATPYGQSHTTPSKIGVTTSIYDTLLSEKKGLQETVDMYYDKLVELGAITRPKTQEEIAQEQAAIIEKQASMLQIQVDQMASQTAILQELMAEIKAIRDTPVKVITETTQPVAVVDKSTKVKTVNK